jgi:hypothetical protein
MTAAAAARRRCRSPTPPPPPLCGRGPLPRPLPLAAAAAAPRPHKPTALRVVHGLVLADVRSRAGACCRPAGGARSRPRLRAGVLGSYVSAAEIKNFFQDAYLGDVVNDRTLWAIIDMADANGDDEIDYFELSKVSTDAPPEEDPLGPHPAPSLSHHARAAATWQVIECDDILELASLVPDKKIVAAGKKEAARTIGTRGATVAQLRHAQTTIKERLLMRNATVRARHEPTHDHALPAHTLARPPTSHTGTSQPTPWHALPPRTLAPPSSHPGTPSHRWLLF